MSSPAIPTTPATRLERPSEGRRISGVCAAIARHQRLDPNVVRVLAVALVLLGGLGVIAYFAGLMLIPAEGADEPLIREGAGGEERRMVILFGVLAAITLLGLPDGSLGLFSDTGRAIIGTTALLAVAVLVLRRDPAGAVPAPPAEPVAPPGGPPSEEPTLVGPGPGAVPPAPSRRPRGGAGRGAAILGGTLLLFAVVGGVLAALDGSVAWDVALCVSLIALGGLTIALAPVGGARILLPFGAVLALFAGVTAAADLELRGGTGDRLERPAALAAGTTDYRLAAGRLVVDLRGADLAPGVTRVEAEVGFGQLVVRVPAGVRLEVEGHTSGGEVSVLGRDDEGLDARRTVVTPGRFGAPVLHVDARVGFGELQVVDATDTLPDQEEDR